MAAAEETAPVRASRRWLQFSLRSMMALMLLAALWAGRQGMRRLEIARERSVLAELEKFGADVQFHQERVAQISFSGRRFRNEALLAVGRLPKLERIVLIDTPVNDAGLAHLAELDRLRELSLIDAPVTDAGLVHVSRLTNLRRLRLDHTQITDDGLRRLARLTNLRRLDLVGTRITDAGLAHLAPLTNLTRLHLNDTQVTDAGVTALQTRLPQAKIAR